MVLSASQAAASEALLTEDGQSLKIDCLLAPYRVIPDDDRFGIAILPGWLAWARRATCEHGGRHDKTAAPPVPKPIQITPLESLIARRGSVSEEMLHRALLESEVVFPNIELVQAPHGPRVRLLMLTLEGREVIPVFTSNLRVPPEPGVRLSRHSCRLLLDTMQPPRAPALVNPRSPLELLLSVNELERLQAMARAAPAR